jgi:hypothetical protein
MERQIIFLRKIVPEARTRVMAFKWPVWLASEKRFQRAKEILRNLRPELTPEGTVRVPSRHRAERENSNGSRRPRSWICLPVSSDTPMPERNFVTLTDTDGTIAVLAPELGGWLLRYARPIPNHGLVDALHFSQAVVDRYPREMYAGNPILFPLVSNNRVGENEHHYDGMAARSRCRSMARAPLEMGCH